MNHQPQLSPFLFYCLHEIQTGVDEIDAKTLNREGQKQTLWIAAQDTVFDGIFSTTRLCALPSLALMIAQHINCKTICSDARETRGAIGQLAEPDFRDKSLDVGSYIRLRSLYNGEVHCR